MQSPPLDPPVDDLAPTAAILTGYDERHLVTYLRLLDAAAEGAEWGKWRRLSCTSIRRANHSARDGHGKAISRAPAG